MKTLPELTTERLVLRGFRPDDAAAVQRVAGDRDVAATVLNVPHPYEDHMAEAWIASHALAIEQLREYPFAITLRDTGELIGSMGLVDINFRHRRAEVGYLLGKSYWNRGYATEALRAVLRYAFEELDLNRVFAYHFECNPASGRVLQKAGFQREGCLRRHVERWGVFHDLPVFGILRDDFLKHYDSVQQPDSPAE